MRSQLLVVLQQQKRNMPPFDAEEKIRTHLNNNSQGLKSIC
jgi:hypothetical protein